MIHVRFYYSTLFFNVILHPCVTDGAHPARFQDNVPDSWHREIGQLNRVALSSKANTEKALIGRVVKFEMKVS